MPDDHAGTVATVGASDLKTELARIAAAVDDVMAVVLPLGEGPEQRLFAAMRYAALGPGKRLRPFLVHAAGTLFGVPEARSLRVGAAIELIHAYSLIHDDLPAMDDDDLRRGRPTVHVAYDEATAILAGDALLPLAFEVVADARTHEDAAIRVALMASLAEVSGAHGMVGGQQLDLNPEEDEATVGSIIRMERLKTGALISFSCEAGAMLAGGSVRERSLLWAYGQDLGLAFQIVDDLLDVEGDEAETGKRVGKDEAAGKATIVGLLGAEPARREAEALVDQAMAHLADFGPAADTLRAIARYVLERRA